MDWDILLCTQLADKRLIAIRFLTTKTEITMNRLDAIAQTFQHQKKGHTVRTAT